MKKWGSSLHLQLFVYLRFAKMVHLVLDLQANLFYQICNIIKILNLPNSHNCQGTK